ncbi:CPBP family intramembrane glutamic endopeptidase [Pseudonocardia sp. GCM10023141]|uniref:CPBP family intramembrane glutamic endopeptidase n=1 Tax=Pseudonocardia sp. GCM10023141 TaxID=3252653 RepID=UPI003614456B
MGSADGDRPDELAGSTMGSGPPDGVHPVFGVPVPGDPVPGDPVQRDPVDAPGVATDPEVPPGPDGVPPAAESEPIAPVPVAAPPYPGAAYAPAGPYQPGPYPSGPYQQVPYQAGPYRQGSYPPGAYPTYPAHPGMPPPSPPPRFSPLVSRTHRWGLGAYVVVEVTFLAVSLLVSFLVSRVGTQTAGTIALALAVPTVIAAGTAILITRLRGNGPRIDLGLEWRWRDVGMGLAFGFGGMLVSIPVSIVYVSIVGQDTNSAVGEVFGEVRAAPPMAVLVLLIVVLLAPFCEEVVYRGLLWGGIERLGANRWVTLAVTTLLFALAHFEFERTPVLLIVAIPIGLARVFTGRLLASIVAHQVNNLLPGIVLVLGLLGLMPAT